MSSSDNCIVVGGGPAGLEAARELTKFGLSVILLEASQNLKGKAAWFCCKASEDCTRCGVCHVDHLADEVQNNPNIEIKYNSKVIELGKDNSKIKIVIQDHILPAVPPQKSQEYTAAGVVWAAGFDLFKAEEKAQFGLGRFANVITGLELEKSLLEEKDGQPHLLESGNVPQKIAFIQCAGSRDCSLSANYCSKVCCAYAIRMASRLVFLNAQVKPTIFYMDLQSPSYEFDLFIKEKQAWINFVRGLPAEVVKGSSGSTAGSGKLLLRYEDLERQQIVSEEFELVVLSVGIRPLQQNSEIAKKAGLALNEDGFLVNSPNSRILAAGTATGPKNIMESMLHARTVAEQLAKNIKSNKN